MNTKKEPTLKLNPQTGFYEGLLLVQVEAELFRRLLIKTVEDDQNADLTDPSTWAQAVNRIGKITFWLNRPGVTVKPVELEAETITAPPAPTPGIPAIPAKPKPEPEPTPRAPMLFETELEADVRARAAHVPPYEWEEKIMSYLPPELDKHSREKQHIYQRRFRERKILQALQEEYKNGTFQLDDEAELSQMEHDEQAQKTVTTKIETIAEVVNGSRLR